MLGISSDNWDNLGSNWDQTKSDFSNGKYIDSARDVMKLKNDPFGSSSGGSNPTLQSQHLGEPDENGYQKINDAGSQHLQAQAAQAQIPDMPSNNTTPDMSQPTLGKSGGIGKTLIAAAI